MGWWGGVEKFSHVNVMAPDVDSPKAASLVTRADFVQTRLPVYGY